LESGGFDDVMLSTIVLNRISEPIAFYCGTDSKKPNAPSQAACLGLLMASAVVVLKHETSTLRQGHNFFLSIIDSTLGVGDYVSEVYSPAQFGSNPMSGRDATWGQHISIR